MSEPTLTMDVVAPLRVVGLHFRGAPIEAEWQWPAGARQVNLSDVLRAVLPDIDGEADAGSQCQLHCDRGVNDTLWWLQTESTTERCAINGEALSPGVAQRLAHGDAFEVGLLRGVIHTESPQPPDPNWQALSASAGDDVLDLTDLEAEDSSGLMSEVQREINEHRGLLDLIGDVDSQLPEASQAMPARPLAQPKPSHSPRVAEPEAAPPSAPSHASEAATSLLDDAGDAAITDAGEDDLLQSLHERYLSHLLNPFASDDAWGGRSAKAAGGGSDDPLEFWMGQVTDKKGLADVMDTVQTIDDIINQMDGLGEGGDILAPETVDDVLQIFAPQTVKTTVNERQRLGLGLPSLTRVEHHSISLDSPMPSSATPRHPGADEQDPT